MFNIFNIIRGLTYLCLRFKIFLLNRKVLIFTRYPKCESPGINGLHEFFFVTSNKKANKNKFQSETLLQTTIIGFYFNKIFKLRTIISVYKDFCFI